MANVLVGALAQRGFEAVDVKSSPNRVYLLGRCRSNIRNMMSAVHNIYLAANNQPWSADFSKSFLLKGGNLVHAYRFIFQSKEPIEKYLPIILAAIANAPEVGVTESAGSMPLHGASANRNAPVEFGGKGAVPSGKFIPKAAMGRMGG